MAQMTHEPDPECPECWGSGWVDDDSACGDPECCSPMVPCFRGCDPYWGENEEESEPE